MNQGLACVTVIFTITIHGSKYLLMVINTLAVEAVFADLVTEHAGAEALEVYGPPAVLAEAERQAAACGVTTRRTGTSVSLLRLDRATGPLPEGVRRDANLEDVFVLLTGEEIA